MNAVAWDQEVLVWIARRIVTALLGAVLLISLTAMALAVAAMIVYLISLLGQPS